MPSWGPPDRDDGHGLACDTSPVRRSSFDDPTSLLLLPAANGRPSLSLRLARLPGDGSRRYLRIRMAAAGRWSRGPLEGSRPVVHASGLAPVLALGLGALAMGGSSCADFPAVHQLGRCPPRRWGAGLIRPTVLYGPTS